MLRRVAPIARPRIPQRAMNTHKPHHTPVPRTTQLRQMIAKGQMSFIMEAHRCVTTLLLTYDLRDGAADLAHVSCRRPASRV